ncbi:MAG TPA: ferredoxin [Pseudonocardiaceae bacterium]|jgi:ferredoxin|nr:ferredoxin [Pseudonocardiaceae bacterium]
MAIITDREVRVGAGPCVPTVSTVFDQSEIDGRVVVVHGPMPVDEDSVRTAARVCPSGAISIA